MEAVTTVMQQVQVSEAVLEKHVYSVWALPPEDVRVKVKKLMEGLRSEFGGPQFEPHVTVVGAIRLTEAEALDRLKKACDTVKPYSATVEKVDCGTFYYQCVYLLLHPTTEVVEASAHCCSHFGYNRTGTYMPHLSLLYGDLTDEEKKKAQEKAYILDEGICSLSFPISHLALCKTDTEDKSCKSWEKVEEYSLQP
ncbi:cyclic phosphodiesterase [Nicotiana tabacum]|uniref:Cyclic phosphodiesterase n=1 Tax=Nicotiana tabacum TaxID=4097 RepID=A0A1S4BIY5_TOBAC|nr:cyclic phosphodiesterase-like [Nicotiana tomentosiformis]XP_016488831.1 PREDICTED: cyclic phosphodiesterase-like [Nicotiana tabacum]